MIKHKNFTIFEIDSWDYDLLDEVNAWLNKNALPNEYHLLYREVSIKDPKIATLFSLKFGHRFKKLEVIC